jgi:hypothetical protein
MRWGVVLIIALAGCQIAPRIPGRAQLDRPMSATWPAVTSWDDSLEDEYAAFVFAIGDAVEDGRCARADECLADPGINPLHDDDEGELQLDVDCADLPYVLRAYFSWKRHLPFGFVELADGAGADLRAATEVTPRRWRTWRDYPTPRALFRALVDAIDTGFYRIPADLETSDFYPVAVDRGGIRPGTVFYDPLGHVSLVARVDDDGSVYFIYGMPHGELLWGRQDAAFATGSASVGSGFKKFRPQSLRNGRIERAANGDLADFDDYGQYALERRVVGGKPAKFHDWVRATLARAGEEPDAVADFRDEVRSLCRAIRARADIVDAAGAAGLPRRPHPRQLPANIYAAGQEWERYATPARDARLKLTLRELSEHLVSLGDDLFLLAPQLLRAWNDEATSPTCRIVYHDSNGDPVVLTVDTVLDRLFLLSFDPYECPELRWGAPPGTTEWRTCPDAGPRRAWYDAEQRLRNRVERVNGSPTPLDDGPDDPPDVDVRKLIRPDTDGDVDPDL